MTHRYDKTGNHTATGGNYSDATRELLGQRRSILHSNLHENVNIRSIWMAPAPVNRNVFNFRRFILFLCINCAESIVFSCLFCFTIHSSFNSSFAFNILIYFQYSGCIYWNSLSISTKVSPCNRSTLFWRFYFYGLSLSLSISLFSLFSHQYRWFILWFFSTWVRTVTSFAPSLRSHRSCRLRQQVLWSSQGRGYCQVYERKQLKAQSVTH